MGGGLGVQTTKSRSLTKVSIGANGCRFSFSHIISQNVERIKNSFGPISDSPGGKGARWSSRLGHMLQVSGMVGGAKCDYVEHKVLSPGSWPPGSDL